jgi:hypothetical protein
LHDFALLARAQELVLLVGAQDLALLVGARPAHSRWGLDVGVQQWMEVCARQMEACVQRSEACARRVEECAQRRMEACVRRRMEPWRRSADLVLWRSVSARDGEVEFGWIHRVPVKKRFGLHLR